MNSLPVNEGAADEVVERFSGSRGHVQDFPGFVSMEVLKSAEEDEVLVVVRAGPRASGCRLEGGQGRQQRHNEG
jgi:heme oxygenase (staphylobilin-producing)